VKAIRIVISLVAGYIYIAMSMFVVGPAVTGRGEKSDVLMSALLISALVLVIASFYFRRHRGLLRGISMVFGFLVPCVMRWASEGIFRNDALSVAAEILLPAGLLLLIWQWPLKPLRRQ
jgi:hypothetical protein